MFLIFLTGAVVLALEVLSSRIMTPYFGVSLFIWASILSITLAFLALGYYLGGWLTRRTAGSALRSLFLLLPIGSAAAVLLAAAIFPALFPALARFDLVIGSFIASAVLLALPLICLSAMNPLLIALRAEGARPGDAGAGQVFFVSTIGSVAGVIATAFAIIPNFTNFSALLWLALLLTLAAAGACFIGAAPPRAHRLRLVVAAALVAVVAVVLLLAQERLLSLATRSKDADERLTLLAEYTSVFGDIKVIELSSASGAYPTIKALLQDGTLQNRTTPENESRSMYTYVLDRLAQSFVPEGRRALALGLGAGIVPRDLKRRGLDVTVVDINADMVEAARTHFGFDPAGFTIHLEDARTFVRRCPEPYDVVIVDLFQGDGTPDYLVTREFFGDLKRCVAARGAVVMNAFFDPVRKEPNFRLLATVHDAFKQLYVFHRPELNSFVVAMNVRAPPGIDFNLEAVPEVLRRQVNYSLGAGAQVDERELRGYAPLTDQQNLFEILAAEAKMNRRRTVVEVLPPRVLVN